MKTKRDLTKEQYENQLKKLGFEKEWLGYWKLPIGGASVCAANAGKRRRDRLDYLLKALEAEKAKQGIVEATQ